MKRKNIIISVYLALSSVCLAQDLSESMTNAIGACQNMSAAMSARSTEQLKAANKILEGV